MSEEQFVEEVCKRFGYTDPRLFTISTLYDLERHDDDAPMCYSPRQIWHFSQILRVSTQELLNVENSEAPVSAPELARMINQECASRKITLDQFEDIVGWSLSACMNPPELLLDDMTLDGLSCLCRELNINWQRVIKGLDSALN